MEMPQELEIWYVIPAIRRSLVVILHKKGMKQKEISKILDISKAAVSQYLKEKRATWFSFNNQIEAEIRKSADAIINDNATLMKEIQRICSLVKKSKMLCDFHKNRCKILDKCDICLK